MADAVKSLDCSLLTEFCFSQILGVQNIREDNRVEFVGGIRGMDELEKRVKSDCQAAFALHPFSMEDVFKVADQGLIMPPKCTWYEPKPRSGLIVNVFSD